MPRADTASEAAVIALARDALDRGMAAHATGNTDIALRWLDRAHRLVPHDPHVKLTLATVCLGRDLARAAGLFAAVAEQHDLRQAWLGLAAARLRIAGAEAAAEPLAAVLAKHAFMPETAGLAQQIAGSLGWCAVRSNGGLEVHPGARGAITMSFDGTPLQRAALPANWARGRCVEIRCADVHLLGSPIQLTAIRRVQGSIEIDDGGLRGWAWHPGDPNTAPVLTLTYPDGREQTIVPTDESASVPDTGPLARPRVFHLSRRDLLDVPGPIRVRGPDGKDLFGSPLDPSADAACHAAAAVRIGRAYPAAASKSLIRNAAHAPALRADAAAPVHPVGAETKRRAPTVVIPVHNGAPVVLACLASVLDSQLGDACVLVIDDGSSDPDLTKALSRLAAQRKITVRRHERTLGFPASANAGIRAAAGRDVVLLNSDTLVPPDWLPRLRDAAYSARDIGTVTPLSNDATILSYPGPAGRNPKPDQAAVTRLDRLARRANGAAVIDIPVGVGFCLYLRRDCLNATGVFRADIFAQGYGEENDLCLRARRLGWRNMALTGLFVGHLGGASFGASAQHLRRRNGRILEQLHPGHHAQIEAFIAADPLAAARRRIDVLAWRQRGRALRQAAILITHNEGGGVEQRIMLSAKAHADAGRRPILLRPAQTASGEPAIAVHDGLQDDLPNLIFAMPQERPALLRLLLAAKADRIEAHHLAGYDHEIYEVIAQLDLAYEVHVHNYAWFCPQISLVGTHNRYCGEPDLPACEACVADNGSLLQEKIGVAALRQRSAAFFAGASRVVVPAEDVGQRMRRHFPDLSPVTVPHEHETAPILKSVRHGNQTGRPKVCVAGAIGVHKGYEVLLACARDADRRDLDLEFVVVGHTIDDARMMATGRVFVTGEFAPGEAVSLIAAQNARLGFVPSICPETWCLTLGELWQAGLLTVAFDIGVPAERIRRTQCGIVLPLGLSANAINSRLVAAIRAAGH